MLPVLFSGNVRDILSDEKKGMCQKKKKTPPNSASLYWEVGSVGVDGEWKEHPHAVVTFGLGVSLSLLLTGVVFLNKLFNLSEPLLREL